MMTAGRDTKVSHAAELMLATAAEFGIGRTYSMPAAGHAPPAAPRNGDCFQRHDLEEAGDPDDAAAAAG